MRLLFFCLWILCLPNLAFAEVKIIELKHRTAADLLGPVRELLDADEKVQAAGNILVLVADGESLLAVESLLGLLDRQLQPLVVRMKLSEQQQQVGQQLSATVSYRGNSQLITTGSGSRRLGNSSQELEQTLSVVEGSGGWFEVGKEIPYKQQWSAFSGETSGYSEQIAYKTVAAGFWVLPVQVIDQSVLVEIEPQINRLAGGEQQGPPKLSFSKLRSRLQIPLGEWYPIGGHLQQHDQVSQDIISWRTGGGEAQQTFYLRIDLASGFSP